MESINISVKGKKYTSVPELEELSCKGCVFSSGSGGTCMTVTDDGRYTSTLCFSSSSQCYIFRPSSEVLGEVADETADEFSIAYTAEMSDETAREIITKVFEKQSGRTVDGLTFNSYDGTWVARFK